MEDSIFTTRTRRTRVATHDGETVGTCIYLSSKELSELDIDVSESLILEYEIGHLNGERAVFLKEVEG